MAGHRKTKGTLGGWRPGAGRKPDLDEPRSVTFRAERRDFDEARVIARVRGENISDVLRAALRAYVKRHQRRAR